MAFNVRFAGRKKECLVHEYFDYNKNKGKNGKSKCLVKNSKGETCGFELSGKNTTNLKTHIIKIHPSVYGELKKGEELKKLKNETTTKNESNSLLNNHEPKTRHFTLPKFIGTNGKWSSKYEEHERRIKAVLDWIVATGCPMTYIDSKEFKLMLKTCDRKFIVPGKKCTFNFY